MNASEPQAAQSVEIPDRVLRGVIDLARLAPSVHNTQPWTWRIVEGNALQLRADRRRALPVSDPEGRNLVISCGAALHTAVVAAKARGLLALVERLPDPTEPDLLATIDLVPGVPPATAGEDLHSIRQRHTDRRRFTSWPVPRSRLESLARAAGHWSVDVVPLLDLEARSRIEELAEQARRKQAQDPGVREELDRWVGARPHDGIPAAAIPQQVAGPGERANRFVPDAAPEADLIDPADGLVVIASDHDGLLAWLCAGEALSALWLAATRDGLSVVPLSQPVEDAQTRAALQLELQARRPLAQILVRVGWQEISRSPLPRTPRRPLHDVLEGC